MTTVGAVSDFHVCPTDHTKTWQAHINGTLPPAGRFVGMFGAAN
jgi:hypothetical protein